MLSLFVKILTPLDQFLCFVFFSWPTLSCRDCGSSIGHFSVAFASFFRESLGYLCLMRHNTEWKREKEKIETHIYMVQ
jgi:hypothetical protein